MEEKQLTSLARTFREGDMDSFKRIVNAMSRPLIAMAYRYTLEWESARDLCQDTWLTVYEKISRYDPERPFSKWLFAIHRNGCLSFIRWSAFRREVSVIDADITPGGGAEASARAQAAARAGAAVRAADCSDPLAELERREFGQRLREAMGCLSERQLVVFTRVDIEQVAQAEAARTLDMNPATLRTTLHNARRRLAARLRKTGAE